MNKKWFFQEFRCSDGLVLDAERDVIDFANKNGLKPGEIIVLINHKNYYIEIMYFAEKKCK